MAVPKKRTSISKKRIRKKYWKRKAYGAALKAFSLGKFLAFATVYAEPTLTTFFCSPLYTPNPPKPKGFGARQRKNPNEIDQVYIL